MKIDGYMPEEKFYKLVDRINDTLTESDKFRYEYSNDNQLRKLKKDSINDYNFYKGVIESDLNMVYKLYEKDLYDVIKSMDLHLTIQDMIKLELKSNKTKEEIYNNIYHESGVLESDTEQSKKDIILRGLKDIHIGANLYALYFIIQEIELN